jgi:hypothetical protein
MIDRESYLMRDGMEWNDRTKVHICTVTRVTARERQLDGMTTICRHASTYFVQHLHVHIAFVSYVVVTNVNYKPLRHARLYGSNL